LASERPAKKYPSGLSGILIRVELEALVGSGIVLHTMIGAPKVEEGFRIFFLG
jgi:hypothetical protein